MKFILGRKIGMTQLFDENERVQPVTLIEVGPCEVTQVKTMEKDAYEAVQLGFVERKKDNKVHKYRFTREFRRGHADKEKLSYEQGTTIKADIFQPHDFVDVRGVTKGKGFQGVVKRHNFGGGPKTHGHRHELRKPGSTGRRFPQHTVPGQRMAGRMGGEYVVVKNLEVLWVKPEENVIAIKGAVAGPKNGLLEIFSSYSSK